MYPFPRPNRRHIYVHRDISSSSSDCCSTTTTTTF
jgi:hypothetical protein